MMSLSRNAYEIFPCSQSKSRPQGTFKWMLGEVAMRTSESSKGDPFAGTARFSSVPELWAHYAWGYLSGGMKIGDKNPESPIYLVVRYEDIVKRPREVVDELERLGLPRSSTPFSPIEESLSGNKAGRAENLKRLRQKKSTS